MQARRGRTDAQTRGFEFETEAADQLGLKLTPGSGSGFELGDARGTLRLSCKASPVDKVSWSEVKRHVAEAVDMAYGTGETPALALEDSDGDQFLIMRLADAGELLRTEAAVVHTPRRGERVRGASKIPLLLRDEGDS